MKKIINSEKEMKDFAISFSKNLKIGDIVLMSGDLGSGKTFFVKSIIENACEVIVNSPTFVLMKKYECSNLKYVHIDAYRLEDSQEDVSYLFEEYEDVITFIEWPSFILEAIPEYKYWLEIKLEGEKRIIEIRSV